MIWRGPAESAGSRTFCWYIRWYPTSYQHAVVGDTNKAGEMALTDTGVRALKAKPSAKKYSDGGGLHLLVTPTGSKLWRLAYRFDGRQKLLALGSYPVLSLVEARKQRDESQASSLHGHAG